MSKRTFPRVVTYTFGGTPSSVIEQRLPTVYRMTLSPQEWETVMRALHRFKNPAARDTARHLMAGGPDDVRLSPMYTLVLLDALYLNNTENAWSLRSAILKTLNIAEETEKKEER